MPTEDPSRRALAPSLETLSRSPLLPAGLLGLIGALDAVQAAVPFHIISGGLLDEPAHLATAALCLTAVAGWPVLRRHATFALTALAASVAIDVDHIPQYAGLVVVDGRPSSHSCVTVGLLLAAAASWPPRAAVLAGAGAGVLLHFVRDLGTGPGVRLWWPLSDAQVRVPYAAYLTVVTAAAVVSAARAARSRQ